MVRAAGLLLAAALTGCAQEDSRVKAQADYLVDSIVHAQVTQKENRLKARNDSTIQALAGKRADSAIAVLKARELR